LDLLGNTEIKRRPTGNQGSGKKFKQWKRNRNGGARYRAGR